ncbi:hypothetical protein [Natrialba sp. PRR66]|uniref:hypothetical protein n=1 Tax=Natrialba sp. PRR66 TaxID=3098146 RepID=UPI002B1DB1FF|nr:hypothetical protein [Natrialba sp. PRR66]
MDDSSRRARATDTPDRSPFETSVVDLVRLDLSVYGPLSPHGRQYDRRYVIVPTR